jgi:hypothetical protein
MRARPGLFVFLLPLGVWAACTAGDGSSIFGDGGGDPSNNGGNNAGGNGQAGVDLTVGNGGSTSSGGINCDSGPDDDADMDGYTPNTGDCNDCDANVNPAAVEVLTPMGGMGGSGGAPVPSDEDCDGDIDEVEICDSGIAVGDPDPNSAAAAIDICQIAGQNGVDWGIVSANYVRANGTVAAANLGAGILPQFGANVVPQRGSAMLGLSSGNARDANDPQGCGSQTCNHNGAGTPPPNFPQNVPGCDGSSQINDDIGLELTLRAPSNANGYSFDFAFMSFEHPEWVCTNYNDQFIALVNPAPAGAINGNISFDSQLNPVSVNLALFDHCDPGGIGSFASFCFSNCPAPPNPYCPLGAAFMDQTGYNEWGDSGSTGWLVTQAPVNPNDEFTIRFAIWDTGDSALDSFVSIDNFAWKAEPGTTVGTEPIPNPN